MQLTSFTRRTASCDKLFRLLEASLQYKHSVISMIITILLDFRLQKHQFFYLIVFIIKRAGVFMDNNLYPALL